MTPKTMREEFENLCESLLKAKNFSVDAEGYVSLDKFTNKIYDWHITQLQSVFDEIENLPKLIKQTRKMLGENQTKFGARFGLPHHSISYYESGTYEAPYRVILFCVDYLRQKYLPIKKEGK